MYVVPYFDSLDVESLLWSAVIYPGNRGQVHIKGSPGQGQGHSSKKV